MTRRTLFWTAAALLGIVLSATVAWSASRLAGQRVGLGSEALAIATSSLAPPESVRAEKRLPGQPRPPALHPSRHRRAPITSTHTRRTSSAPPVTIPALPSGASPPATSSSGSGSASSGPATATTTTPASSSGSGDDVGGGSRTSSGRPRNQGDD